MDAVVEREDGAEAGLTEAGTDLSTDAEVAEVADSVADGAHGEIAEVVVVAAAGEGGEVGVGPEFGVGEAA